MQNDYYFCFTSQNPLVRGSWYSLLPAKIFNRSFPNKQLDRHLGPSPALWGTTSFSKTPCALLRPLKWKLYCAVMLYNFIRIEKVVQIFFFYLQVFCNQCSYSTWERRWGEWGCKKVMGWREAWVYEQEDGCVCCSSPRAPPWPKHPPHTVLTSQITQVSSLLSILVTILGVTEK